jgi:hypothetical protein
MNSTVHIPLAVLELILLLPLVYVICRKYLIPVLFRDIVKARLGEIGAKAIAKLPPAVHLLPSSQPSVDAVERQVQPLLNLGFVDLGNYSVDTMPGLSVRALFQSGTHVAAHIYESPKAGIWVELVTRYVEGSTFSLSTLPETGVESAPWVQTIRADKSVPPDQLYQQLLTKRRGIGIKAVKASEAVQEFEEAYSRIMAWKREHGISAQEVARVAVNLTIKKKAASTGA